jgi:hypothetical protein
MRRAALSALICIALMALLNRMVVIMATDSWTNRVWTALTNSQDAYNHIKSVDYAIAVARGDISGVTSFGSYGERTTGGAETNRVIWPNGVFSLPSSSGVQMSLVSTSTNDTDGGSHANAVTIYYLDANLLEKSEEINLYGTSPVLTTATDIRFIQCMLITSAGTSAFADGTITASNGGVTYSQIAPSDTRCASSARMVPAGKRAFVAGAVGSATSGTSAARVKIRVVASEIFGVQYISPLSLIPFGSIGVQDGSEAYTFPVPGIFSAGTVIAMTTTTDKAANVNGSWYGWLESL